MPELAQSGLPTRDFALDNSSFPVLLTHYQIHGIIGEGGMGTVFKATQLSLHRDVALKVLAPALSKDRNFVDLFINEARAAAQLIHPNIVQVYDAGTEGETSFFSMEYLGKGSVEELLTREKKMPWGEAILMVLEAAHGLEYAEGKGIVHRDIKPDNLMLNEDGRIKIADLGLAKRAEDVKEEGVIGTDTGCKLITHCPAEERPIANRY